MTNYSTEDSLHGDSTEMSTKKPLHGNWLGPCITYHFKEATLILICKKLWTSIACKKWPEYKVKWLYVYFGSTKISNLKELTQRRI